MTPLQAFLKECLANASVSDGAAPFAPRPGSPSQP